MTPTSFTVSWNASSGVPTPQYQTQYRLTGTTAFTPNPLGSTSALTQTVSNLSPPGASWDVVVVASNIAGSATSSPPVTIQLPASQTVIFRDVVGNAEWLAVLSASPSGTLLTTTSGKIVDTTGAVWTLVGSPLVVNRNGVSTGSGPGVQALLYYNNGVYYEGANSADWFAWNGTAWVPTFDPRGAQPAASPSGTTLTTTTGTIVDASGVTWSLVPGTGSNLQVAHNGVVDQTFSNVTLLLFYNGAVYVETPGLPQPTPTPTPTITPTPTPTATPTPTPVSVPVAVTGITVSPSGNSLNVGWSAQPGNVTYLIIGSTTGANGPFTLSTNTTALNVNLPIPLQSEV